jgi:hypothetical protein
MDEEDCGKRYLCELAAGDALDTEEQRTLSFFQVFNTAWPEFKKNVFLMVSLIIDDIERKKIRL